MRKSFILFLVLNCFVEVFSQELPANINIEYFELPPSIKIDNYNLNFTEIDSPSYQHVYNNHNLRDSIEAANVEQIYAAYAIEKIELQQQPVGFIKRASGDSVLWHITLESGKVYNLKTRPDWGISDYIFEHFYPEERILVFRIRQYEGGGYLLFNQNTGDSYYTMGPPIFSKSRKYFICVNEDTLSSYTTNGLDVFELVDGNPELLFFYDPGMLGPTRVNWINESTLNIEFYSLLIVGPPTGTWEVYKHYQLKFEKRKP